ncbi:endonuclease [Lutibacter maritimus]|uniref:Por secretion system C-terminal sorting domain-containing protein n=1 Tax=Lutibacter maritimus TaxID=593133 RepID=A0A1I6SPB3_9FLAO|nr:endonuclease [Lutibacter maritimus]SFS78769.1 Por secretion system C-terminal sorting domain-containing protein [Lutibacter maritimus]
MGTGYTLKTQLYNIIKGHTDNGYSGLWVTYETSDRDYFYENDGTILDMYSENPSASDPYNYTITTDQCGTYSVEGNCYNREHIIPQSVFNQVSPERNDAHFITATDGKVNGMRSNYPHGMVGTATYTSQNGSKLGAASNSGYAAGYTGTVFEPIDEFKGDIARMYFYFATRYENELTTWGVSYAMFDGSTNKVFTEPFLTILMTWHQQDPVSSYEIARNNAIYARQNNRNPFIDHPEYVAQIWSATPDSEAPSAPTNLIASNETNTTIDLNWTASTDNIGVTSYEIFKDGVLYSSAATNSHIITGLTQNTTYNFTVYAKDAYGNTSLVSNTETATTTNFIDVTAPTKPTNVIVSNETNASIKLTWTPSTDAIGVANYDIYVDGIYHATSTATSYTVTGLTALTIYSFTIIAKDAAGNSSAASDAVNGTTIATPSICASETFDTIGASNSSYTTVTWTGDNGGSWSATDARTDQVLNGKAITIRNGAITSPTTVNGIANLTVTTQLVFTGTSGTFDVKVNGNLIGTIPYDATEQTTTISGINTSGNVIITIDGNSTTSNRVIFDDISWSCYSGVADTEAPTAITDLNAASVTNTTALLSWSASTDNIGVSQYDIYKNGVYLTSVATNSYNVTALTANTSYHFTVYAKDAAGNTSEVSNTLSITTTNTSITASELFISEYIEGSGNNKAIEIANFTGSPIDLSVYSIKKQANGAGAWVNEIVLSGSLANNNVYVIANSGSNTTILAAANRTVAGTPMDFNGNDPIGLFKNGVLIDIVGVLNNTANFAINTTLRRKSTITAPNTSYTVSEWDTFASDTADGLGTHTVSSLSVPEFIENLFSVYPNPTNTHSVTISFKKEFGNHEVQLFNFMGQLLYAMDTRTTFKNKIEVKNIPTGLYILKVFNDQYFSTKKIIVN